MPKRVLVVEDDPDMARSIADVLEADGFHVAIANNGLEALTRLCDGHARPDLILLDLMMPVMDGWKFREKQRHLPEVAAIPVVAISADGHVRRKASDLNADGYVSKPVGIDELLREIERICGPPQ